MKTTANRIHKAISEAKPKTFDELMKVLGTFRFCNGLAWSNVYYIGAYQGIRIHYFDSKKRRIELPARDSVYCIAEYKELGRINVNSKGHEIR